MGTVLPYRPFSAKYFFDVLPKTVKKIAVLIELRRRVIAEPLHLDQRYLRSDQPVIVEEDMIRLQGYSSQIKAVFDT